MTDSERQEVREKIAGLLGWKKRVGNWAKPSAGDRYWEDQNGRRVSDHPVPLTLDGLAALWPELYPFIEVSRYPRFGKTDVWMAVASDRSEDGGTGWNQLCVRNHETEYDARLALLCAVLESEKGKEKA